MIMMNDMVCTLVKAKENLSNMIKSVRFNESKINKNTIQNDYMRR